MLTAEKIQEIADGCEGVTRGPWSNGRDLFGDIMSGLSGVAVVVGRPYEPEETKANALHIARLDPVTVRFLCALALDGLRMREMDAATRDAMIGGSGFLRLDIDGSAHRIAPDRVMIATEEPDND